jgi:hypothetical protein
MKTKIEELKAKHAEELAAATAESEILAAIESATGLAPHSVHLYPLYGRDGSATFGDTFHTNPFATLDEVESLATAFPPVARLKRKNGCVSFPTEKWWDAQPDAEAKESQVQAIAPFLFSLDFACTPSHGHTPRVEISWCAEIAGRIIEIECVLSPHEVCRWSFDSRDRKNELRHILDTKVTFPEGWAAWAGDSAPVLHHQTGGDSCERMHQIKWSRGSDDSGHKFTFYSGCYDANLAHHVRRLRALASLKF